MAVKIKTHELNTWPEYFEVIFDGRKRFDVRDDDRGYKVGDTLHLREWCPDKRRHTGRAVGARIDYILNLGKIRGAGVYCTVVLSLSRVVDLAGGIEIEAEKAEYSPQLSMRFDINFDLEVFSLFEGGVLDSFIAERAHYIGAKAGHAMKEFLEKERKSSAENNSKSGDQVSSGD